VIKSPTRKQKHATPPKKLKQKASTNKKKTHVTNREVNNNTIREMRHMKLGNINKKPHSLKGNQTNPPHNETTDSSREFVPPSAHSGSKEHQGVFENPIIRKELDLMNKLIHISYLTRKHKIITSCLDGPHNCMPYQQKTTYNLFPLD